MLIELQHNFIQLYEPFKENIHYWEPALKLNNTSPAWQPSAIYLPVNKLSLHTSYLPACLPACLPDCSYLPASNAQ